MLMLPLVDIVVWVRVEVTLVGGKVLVSVVEVTVAVGVEVDPKLVVFDVEVVAWELEELPELTGGPEEMRKTAAKAPTAIRATTIPTATIRLTPRPIDEESANEM